MQKFVPKQILSLIIGILFLIVGIFAYGSAAKSASFYENLEANGTQASASVTDVKHQDKKTRKNNRTKTKTYETITVTYEDDKGAKHTITDKEQLKGSRANIGDKETVYYDKTLPSQAVIKGDNDSGTGKLLGSIFAVVGAGLVAFSTISTIRRRNALT